MSRNESDSNGLAHRFAAWLRRHMDENDWSNTSVASAVWGSENGRGHVSGYLNARKGNPTRLTIMKFCDKLGIPREEGEALLRDAPEPETVPERNWPEIIPLGITADRNVIGREADVETLRANLTETTATAITPGTSGATVVKGRGGMGKTTLARHYIQTHRSDYFGIWWLRAQDGSTAIEDLAKLARRVGVAEPGADAEANAEQALAYLQGQSEPWLLVYDNAESFNPLRDLMPEQDNIHVLLTSREGNWPPRFTEQPANALAEDEAIALLRQESGRTGNDEGGKALVHALDQLPLAIVAAGAWLKDVSEEAESFADYEGRLAKRIAERPEGVGDYPDSVFAAIKLSLDKLSPDAALLMKVFCWLSPDDLWPALVTGLDSISPEDEKHERFEQVPSDFWTLARDAPAVDHAFADLRNRSLLDQEGEESWRLHRLTQAVQQGVLLGDDATNWRAVAAATLAVSYPGGANTPQHRENWPICARLDPHLAALADNDPHATAAMDYLLNQASIYLHAQRMDDRALRYAEESLRLTEARLGKDHAELGAACNNLAARYWRLGRMAEAEAMAARTIEIVEDRPNVAEANFAIALSTHGHMAMNLATELTSAAQREKLDLAEQRFQQALEIGERLHGRQSREVATRLNNLAGLHAWQGKSDQAISRLAEVVEIDRATQNPDAPDLGTSLHNLAGTLLNVGRARQGHEGQGVLDLLEEAQAIYEDAFDRVDHPDRVETAGWLARAHWALLELGTPITGTIQPDGDRAAALCETYGLDPAAMKAHAADFVRCARAHEAGQVVPGEMQLQNERAERIAEKLAGEWEPRAAYETLSGNLAPTDMTDAYRVQEVLQQKFETTRGAIAGRKIALTSKAMQEMVNIDQPVAAAIFANDIHHTGAEISLSTFRHLGLEYELAFELGQDVSERVEAKSVLALVAGVRPAFELIEDRDADYGEIDVKTLVADNAWCGGVVLGEPIEGWRDLDLGDLPSVLSQEGVPDEAGNTGAADPVNSLVWVLNHFVGRGAVVKAGEVIITGSVLKTRFPVPGDRVRYEIAGHAAVEVSLVA